MTTSSASAEFSRSQGGFVNVTQNCNTAVESPAASAVATHIAVPEQDMICASTISTTVLPDIPILGQDYQSILGFLPVSTPGGPTGTYGAPSKFPQFEVFCDLRSPRKSYHLGEKIEVYVSIKNRSPYVLKMPAFLVAPEGTALFRILDDEWNLLPHPESRSCVDRKRKLFHGWRTVYKIVLNVPGGYRFVRPGLYHLVFLGSDLGLPDSNQLTLRIEP